MDNIPINQHLRNMSIKPQMLMYPFEAESIAYVVCQYFGLDTSEYSFGYISTWSGGKDTQELKNSLEIIRNTSNDIISKVEQKLTKTDSLKQAENISAIPKRKCM